MTTPLIVEDVLSSLHRRYGRSTAFGRSRLRVFGSAVACSVNYSKLLSGHRYFFGLAQEVVDPDYAYPATEHGDFVLLVCGGADKVLVLPRGLVVEMMRGVTTRKIDVFVEDCTYILQTTRHPKRNVTEFLNRYPKPKAGTPDPAVDEPAIERPDRVHVRIQSALIDLGRAEGCSVWVPANDRSLSYENRAFAPRTIDRLPHLGLDENTRRIVHSIDVLWLAQNIIRKAFEVESTTVIYSGLLRLNDLVVSQPNIQIDLYIVAARARRQRVHDQLTRPSFRGLLSRCAFIGFEDIEEQVHRLHGLPVDEGVRVTGLLRGEKFTLPDHYVYPSGL